MSLMNDALRKKESELKRFAGSIGAFGRKSGEHRSRNSTHVRLLFISFLAVLIGGAVL